MAVFCGPSTAFQCSVSSYLRAEAARYLEYWFVECSKIYISFARLPRLLLNCSSWWLASWWVWRETKNGVRMMKQKIDVREVVTRV